MRQRLDDTLPLLATGYPYLSLRGQELGADDAFPLRFLGQRAVCLRGREAAQLFYDNAAFTRQDALPGLVLDTIFGRGAVHTLAGEAHRVRKGAFLQVLGEESSRRLVEAVASAWDDAIPEWPRKPAPVVLFDEVSRILLTGVCAWAGVPLDRAQTNAIAADMTAMVDGVAAVGPRHWRARAARRRSERWATEAMEQARHSIAAGTDDDGGGASWVLATIARHRDENGALLPAGVAGVELLNLIRPSVAVSWLVTFAADALHRWPHYRDDVVSDPQRRLAFVHELRRFYPFAPFVGALSRVDLEYRGVAIPRDTLALLDIYGHNHDERIWTNPYTFDPDRFSSGFPGAFDLVPQGGGDTASGHRCPGENATVLLLSMLCARLAQLTYEVVDQDLTISLRRMPTRPADGFLMRPRAST